jgi:adenylate cyclase
VERRLAAILVADVVSYSELMRKDEAATHRQVRADLKEVLLPTIQEHHGRVVKTMGDGLIAEFSSIVECVQCAIEIQESVTTPRPDAASDEPLRYRIGINLGDIIVEDGDVFGDGVNIAARLQGLADPGGILLSDDAYRQIRGKLVVAFEDLGDHVVKSIAEPVHVYRIASQSDNEERRPTEVGAAPPSVMPSIAVLPFDNISDDPDQGYFSDGLTNDLITGLSKFSELFVVASHSVFAYKGKAARVQSLGRVLGARYIVEGSVQRSGDSVRINVQLIDATRDRHLWAEHYDRQMKDLWALQDEIVQTIVGTLVARVDFSEYARAVQKSESNLAAYDLYLRGRAAWHDWTRESNLQAKQCFAKVIELDPTFALAHGYLSYTLVQEWLAGWSISAENLSQARSLAEKAVALGPTEYENYWSLAFACLYSHEFDRSFTAFERAVKLNPNSPDVLIDMADGLIFIGRLEEAMAKVERAMVLNPLYPDSYLWTLGVALYHSARYESALDTLMRIAHPPNLARRHLAAAHVRLGHIDEAQKVVAEFLRYDPDYTLDREKRWPYKDGKVLEALVADLRTAGLPG